MGQYYVAIILGERNLTTKEFIRMWMCPGGYSNGSKLTEHCYKTNKFVQAFEYLLTPEGMAYKSRAVWAGDYADKEPASDGEEPMNLHSMTDAQEQKVIRPPHRSTAEYRYIINHDKKQYVDKDSQRPDADGFIIHPLPLLLAEGNGQGGGDYRGNDEMKVGIWARDVISVEKEVPEGYTKLEVNFYE
jgi:hypothetical protein